MLTIFILTVIGFVVFMRDADKSERIFCGAISGLLAGMIFYIPFEMIVDREVVHTTPVLSLNDSTGGSEGNFFLGTGSVHGAPAFFYYAGSSTGGATLEYLLASESTVYETDDVAPHIEEDCTTMDHIPNVFTFPIANMTGDSCSSEYRIYVPENSIQRQFVLDAE